VNLWEGRFEDHFGIPACPLAPSTDVIPHFAGGGNAPEEYSKNKRARGRRKSRLMRLRGKSIEKIFFLWMCARARARVCVCAPPPWDDSRPPPLPRELQISRRRSVAARRRSLPNVNIKSTDEETFLPVVSLLIPLQRPPNVLHLRQVPLPPPPAPSAGTPKLRNDVARCDS